jgi:hypothetical protein
MKNDNDISDSGGLINLMMTATDKAATNSRSPSFFIIQ